MIFLKRKLLDGLLSALAVCDNVMKAICLEFKVIICDGTEDIACFSDVLHS